MQFRMIESVMADPAGAETQVRVPIFPDLFPGHESMKNIYARMQLLSLTLEWKNSKTLAHDGQVGFYLDWDGKIGTNKHQMIDLLSSRTPYSDVMPISQPAFSRIWKAPASYSPVDTNKDIFSPIPTVLTYLDIVTLGYNGITGSDVAELVGYFVVTALLRYVDQALPPTGDPDVPGHSVEPAPSAAPSAPLLPPCASSLVSSTLGRQDQ